jgi:hypothetical protein
MRSQGEDLHECDDGILQVICPTCQTVVAGSRMAGDRQATLHGVVFDILGTRAAQAMRLARRPERKAAPAFAQASFAREREAVSGGDVVARSDSDEAIHLSDLPRHGLLHWRSQ